MAMHQHRISATAPGWILATLTLPLLWWSTTQQAASPLPLAYASAAHSAIDFGTLLASMVIFGTAYRATQSPYRTGLRALAIGFGAGGLLDLYRIISESQSSMSPHVGTGQTAQLLWLLARLLVNAAVLAHVLIPPRQPSSLRQDSMLRPFTTLLAWLLLATAVGISLSWPQQDAHTQWGVWIQQVLALLISTSSLATLATLWLQYPNPAQEGSWEIRLWSVLTFLASLFYLLPGDDNSGWADLAGDTCRIFSYLYLYLHVHREHGHQTPDLSLQTLRESIMLNAAPDGILLVDPQGRILMLNPAMEKLSGYREHELQGKDVELLVPPTHRSNHGHHVRQFFSNPKAAGMGKLEVLLHRRDGSELPVDIAVGEMRVHGERQAIAYVRDTSAMKQARDTLRHSSTHDELTGLPNRWLFTQRLMEATRDTQRLNRHVAVMLLDLDNFKSVNDGFGHSTGDALLCQVTERIRGSLGIEDFLARLGGDEFAILLSNIADPDHAESAAARILHALERPYLLKDQEVNSSGSLGIAFFPRDAKNSDDLLRCADIAMYRAKRAGRGSHATYTPDMRGQALENLAMHTRLKAALRDGGLRLHYQPQVSVHNGSIVGAEALVRWDDPKLGPVSPARFVPVAEATGLILPLSDWILDEACRTIAQWQRAGMELPVAVNFSAHQFSRPDLFEKVRDALARHGVPPRLLDVEITETAAMNHPENTRTQINALVDIGCHVTLDDFGTGYSSLAYLKDFPVTKLKIDKSFMDGIPAGKNDITICKAIMAMARNLNIRLVAEGVEHTAQLNFLRQNGCDMYQGWLFAKAMSSEQLLELHAHHAAAVQHPGPIDDAALHRMHLYPQALDLTGALRRMGGNEIIYRRSAQAFCDSLEQLLPALNDARGAGNRQLGSMLLHSYKGNAATIGLSQFAKYMAHLEAALATDNWQYILESKCNELQSWVLATREELKQALAGLSMQQGNGPLDTPEGLQPRVAPSSAQAMEALSALQALLGASDLSALQLYEQVRPALQGIPERHLQALDDALNRLDLDSALSLCNRLLAESEALATA